MAPDTRIVWEAAMRDMTRGLDMEDADDRAIFRSKVADRVKHLRVDFIRQLSHEVGRRATRQHTRAHAARSLADGYIDRMRGIVRAPVQG